MAEGLELDLGDCLQCLGIPLRPFRVRLEDLGAGGLHLAGREEQLVHAAGVAGIQHEGQCARRQFLHFSTHFLIFLEIIVKAQHLHPRAVSDEVVPVRRLVEDQAVACCGPSD